MVDFLFPMLHWALITCHFIIEIIAARPNLELEAGKNTTWKRRLLYIQGVPKKTHFLNFQGYAGGPNVFGSIYVVVQSVLSAQMGADSYLGLQGGSNYTGLALIRRLWTHCIVTVSYSHRKALSDNY